MSATVADVMWDMLVQAGVKRCYGIVGDALNPTMSALRRNDGIEFIHVRHEEFGAFAAVADAHLSGVPVAVCGTAGPGVVHLVNGLLDARRERAPIIAIAGDVDTAGLDAGSLEELNPYKFFDTAALYIGRLVNPAQLRTVVGTAITTAVANSGPTVIALPGDVAAAEAPPGAYHVALPASTIGAASAADLDAIAALVNGAETVAIFGGDGCRHAQAEVRELAHKLNAPVGYSLKGKQWLEADNPNAVGMTGLLGYGSCYDAIHDADVLLMLGTDFPFTAFLPQRKVKIVQIDSRAEHLGRRAPIELGVVGDVRATVATLTPKLDAKQDDGFLRKHRKKTAHFHRSMQHYVDRGPEHTPIRPEYLFAQLDELAASDALFFADTGTACIWASRHLQLGGGRQLFGSFSWASMANASPNAFGGKLACPDRQSIALCGDGGFTMLALGDLITEVQHRAAVVHLVLANELLDFVHIEQEEAGLVPYGTELPTPNLAAVAEALGAKGLRLDTPEQIRPVLSEALAHTGGPVVIDARVDKYALSLPSHVPLHTARGFTLSLTKQAIGGHLSESVATVTHNVGLV